jgi:hypothetical protein
VNQGSGSAQPTQNPNLPELRTSLTNKDPCHKSERVPYCVRWQHLPPVHAENRSMALLQVSPWSVFSYGIHHL